MVTKFSKRIGLWLLILTLLTAFLAAPIKVEALTFKDVKSSDWFYSYIMTLATEKVVNGYPNGTFRPDKSIERQHVCAMIVKAAGIDEEGKVANFSDVPKNSDFSPYIGVLQELGVIGGFPDGSFRPKQTLTRAELCKIIARTFSIKSAGKTSGLKDINGHWGENDIRKLASNGIVKGYADGTFKPARPVTRAEAAKIILLARAVKAVQYAETQKTQKATYAAEKRVNELPDNQDKATKKGLAERINLLKIPSKDNAWFKKTITEWGAKLTLYYNDVVENVDPSTGVVTRIVPIYYEAVCIVEIKDDYLFTNDDMMMTDSGNTRWNRTTLDKQSIPLGKLPLMNDFEDQLGWVSEGYQFYKITPGTVPHMIAYWDWRLGSDFPEWKVILPVWE